MECFRDPIVQGLLKACLCPILFELQSFFVGNLYQTLSQGCFKQFLSDHLEKDRAAAISANPVPDLSMMPVIVRIMAVAGFIALAIGNKANANLTIACVSFCPLLGFS